MSRLFKESWRIVFPDLPSKPSRFENFPTEEALLAPLGVFLSAHSKEIASQTLYGERHPFFFDGACSAHLLGANEVQPTTSFAPRRGAHNIMTLLN